VNTHSPRHRCAAAAVWFSFMLGFMAVGCSRSEPATVNAKELHQQLQAAELSPGQRRDIERQYSDVLDRLSPAQRLLWEQQTQKELQSQLDRLFALPRDQRVAYLDEQINRCETARRYAEAGQEPPAAPPTLADAIYAVFSDDPTAPPAARQRSMKAWLDSTTPEQRAEMQEYYHELQDRRTERGLSGGGSWDGCRCRPRR
jgi:hypothetical protein